MSFVEKALSVWLPAAIYTDPRNSRKDIDKREYSRIQKENGNRLAYFNGLWYDIGLYIRLAAQELGDISYFNEAEHSELCRKYADNFIKNVLSGDARPVRPRTSAF